MANTNRLNGDQYLSDYIRDQNLAEKMIPSVGQLYRNHGVVITIFGRKLMNASVIDIIKAHRVSRNMLGRELSLAETTAVLQLLERIKLLPCRIDIGKLVQVSPPGGPQLDSVREALSSVVQRGAAPPPICQDVVLYGFGRIGRVLARLLIERTTAANKLRLRAVVVRAQGGKDGDLEKRASLLRRDSIHGPFNGSITLDKAGSALIANGNYIRFLYADRPEELDYRRHGIDHALVVDNTGAFKDEAGLSRHLLPAGADKVLLTAPAGGAIKNIVYGVNHHMIEPDERILCTASCTTNAITPVFKAIDEAYGVVSGHVETVHSYTNDQNLVDNYHTADRRGRSAPLNMVLTSTGAANAVAKALPNLAGKLTANAIRVPTPNVSMAVIHLNLAKPVSRDALNDYIRQVSLASELSEQIAYSASSEVVSSDFIGTPEPAIFDSVATIAKDNRCILYVWYDNEFGYANQVIRVMRVMAGLKIPSLPVAPVPQSAVPLPD